jgi:hypothetical protein
VRGSRIDLDFATAFYQFKAIAELNSKGAAAMSEYLNEMIGYDVQRTAEWRHRKAEEFPDDSRNLVAAEELERLAREIHALNESEIERQIEHAHNRITAINDAELWVDVSGDVSVELRSIGFHGSHRTAIKLLEWYRDLLIEKLKESTDEAYDLVEEAVPAPDLRERVENDPRVKKAKRAYEKAHAKALAEARKTA